MRIRRLITLLAAAAAVLGGCAAPTLRPDLERLYASATGDARQPPVILIPGIMGSRIINENGDELWIGSLWRAVFSSYDDLALDIDPETLLPKANGTVVGGITDEFAGRDFYASIIRTLESAGGYRPGTPGQPATPGIPNYYVFTYDWRQDNVLSARKLSRLIDQIRADYGQPDLMVDIIAHSMGGLITRYYLRYGEKDVLDDNAFSVNRHGAGRVRRVVMLGTPNLGSVSSLQSFIVGHKIGLKRLRTEALATFPSIYQLLPHPLNDWIVSGNGKVLDRDLFDISLWRRFQWSIFDPKVRQRILKRYADKAEGDAYLRTLETYFHKHIERARRFVWSLTVNFEPPPPWKMVVFGGDCSLTPARVIVEDVEGISELRLKPGEISNPQDGLNYDRIMLEPGDGAVTKASLLARETFDPLVPRHRYSYFPLAWPLFLCEEHDRLTTNAFFQDNLLHFLLNRD